MVDAVREGQGDAGSTPATSILFNERMPRHALTGEGGLLGRLEGVGLCRGCRLLSRNAGVWCYVARVVAHLVAGEKADTLVASR